MNVRLPLACLASLVLVAGCATKDYGRMDALAAQDKTTLDCRQIDGEIVKAQTFINDVHRKSEFSAADVLAFRSESAMHWKRMRRSRAQTAGLRA